MNKLNQGNLKKDEENDNRLSYTLTALGLEDLIHLFQENNITFADMLLLSKDDLKALQLELYQRNRIWNFSNSFTKYAKKYSLIEIIDFLNFNKQFIFQPSNTNKTNQNNSNMNYQLTATFCNISKNHLVTTSSIEEDKNSKNKMTIQSKNEDIEEQMNPISKNDIINAEENSFASSKDKLLVIKDKEQNEFKFEDFKKNKLSNNNNIINNQSKELQKKIPLNQKSNNNNNNKPNSSDVFNNYLCITKESDKNNLKLHNKQSKNKNPESKSKNKQNINNNYGLYQQNYYEEKEYEHEENAKEENDNEKENNYLQEKYEQMIEKIEEIEKFKLDYCSFQYISQIKKFINDKRNNITINDIQRLIDELDKLKELKSKKEMLQKSLDECNLKINNKKKKLNLLKKDNNVKNTFEVQEVEEEYEQESLN